eukprot:GEMP01026757.1.p1 GENE.GEMP01026757.1~~GEMP01026757.1.p1  ORF type:complete len:414 (+),score=7.78 GEMP01026757.1:196-1437(+)
MLIGSLRTRFFTQYRWYLPLLTSTRRLSSNLPLPTCLPYGGNEDLKRIEELEIKVDQGRQAPSPSWAQKHPQKGVERLNSSGNLFCYKCKMFQHPGAFNYSMRNKYGRTTWCKACVAESTLQYYGFTLRGALTRILGSAKLSAARRSTVPGREAAGRCDIDLSTLLDLWLCQQGRCAYSGLVMSVEPYTSWRFSLERLDNRVGYTPQNVAFTCSEFNTTDITINAKYYVDGSSQWSSQKVQSLPNVISTSIPITDYEINKLMSSDLSPICLQMVSKRNITATGELLCTKCNRFKSPHEFSPNSLGLAGRSSICRKCAAQYAWSFKGFFKRRLRNAKTAAERRTVKGRVEAGIFDLSLDDVLTLYERQRGLCFYSGVKLTLKPVSDWMCSLGSTSSMTSPHSSARIKKFFCCQQ